MTFTCLLFPGRPANVATSADTRRQPSNRRYNLELGEGRVTGIGTTDLARTMSFPPRNIPPSLWGNRRSG